MLMMCLGSVSSRVAEFCSSSLVSQLSFSVPEHTTETSNVTALAMGTTGPCGQNLQIRIYNGGTVSVNMGMLLRERERNRVFTEINLPPSCTPDIGRVRARRLREQKERMDML